MAYTYNDQNSAILASPVSLADALQVVACGRKLLVCFDRYGTGDNERTAKAFHPFLESLYGAGLVMSDFDGPRFDNGPMHLLFQPGIAALVAQASNLLTVRMFIHTLARGHRFGSEGWGYAYFDRAYQSGGLRALIERLDAYCTLAQRHGWPHLQDDPDLELIRAVPV